MSGTAGIPVPQGGEEANYTLTRLEAGWLVTAYSGKAVASCPA